MIFGSDKNNGRVWQKKVMFKKNQDLQEEEVDTFLLGNDKNNVIVNYLFIKLVFVLKLSGLNGYLKGYLKSKINKLSRKNKNKFSIRRCRFIKDISVLSFLIQHIYTSPLRND